MYCTQTTDANNADALLRRAAGVILALSRQRAAVAWCDAVDELERKIAGSVAALRRLVVLIASITLHYNVSFVALRAAVACARFAEKTSRSLTTK